MENICLAGAPANQEGFCGDHDCVCAPSALLCIHYRPMDEFCQACQDRSQHILALEHERLFGYDYA